MRFNSREDMVVHVLAAINSKTDTTNPDNFRIIWGWMGSDVLDRVQAEIDKKSR